MSKSRLKHKVPRNGWKTGILLLTAVLGLSGMTGSVSASSEQTEEPSTSTPSGKKVVLRICNWEEYIDLGEWEESDTIDLESGDIFGENSMIDDFEEWYRDTYGINVKVEYSTFGTNEDLYNMLTLGDVYDLVCPSEYMFMKLMAEKQLVPLSDSFKDSSNPYNYYTNGVSP